jgi:catechol 2,3-dioxygenase-like lactoylglutathione lyase family enzyme
MSLHAPQFCSAATLFVVQDVPKAVAHYRDVLGFKVGFTYGDPVFLRFISRPRTRRHANPAKAPSTCL